MSNDRRDGHAPPTAEEKLAGAMEAAMCADINLENLAKAVPGLASHPFYKIVRMQMAETFKRAEIEPFHREDA